MSDTYINRGEPVRILSGPLHDHIGYIQQSFSTLVEGAGRHHAYLVLILQRQSEDEQGWIDPLEVWVAAQYVEALEPTQNP